MNYKTQNSKFKSQRLKIWINIFLCAFISTTCIAQNNDTNKIDVEKIIIDRVRYHIEKINMVMTTFSKFFTDYKNMDILKYAVCKYLLPRYLYTNSLQLLSHQLILNLKKKCPLCVLSFYKTLQETPEDFQWAAKILSFVPKFADYKLKIQAFHTLLQTFNFYAEDIISIAKEGNPQKILDYITLIEEELINVYSETYTNWDQTKKECSINYVENMSFGKCLKDKEIPRIDKGNTNCECDNRIPLTSYEYFNAIPHYPLDAIFEPNITYSSHFLDKIKEALNFYYTFKKYIEENFATLYKIFYPAITENEDIVYELCKKACSELQDPTIALERQNQLIAYCQRATDEQKCRNIKCFWCNNQCEPFPFHCSSIKCKNTAEVDKSVVKRCDTTSRRGIMYTDKDKISLLLNCAQKYFTQEEVLKLCKKFSSVWVCEAGWIHKIENEEYDEQMLTKDCYLYDICKCFDKSEIEASKDDIELPRCEPVLPR